MHRGLPRLELLELRGQVTKTARGWPELRGLAQRFD